MAAGRAPSHPLRSAPTPRRRPQSVLFACSHNSVRSPIAEAIARHHFGHEIFFASAGLRAGPSDPFAAAVMQEIGLDLARHHPQSFDDLDDMNFDIIVSLSPEAHHRALEYTRSLAVDVEFWRTLDPTATQGSRDTILEAYRVTRDSLSERILAAFGPGGVWGE